MLPLVPAVGVTVKVSIANITDTTQSAVTGPVVNTSPTKLPPHVLVAELIKYPKFGVTVNDAVWL